MKQYKPCQRLWKIARDPEGYYYEIKLGGIVIDRIRVEQPALGVLERSGEI